MAKRVKESEIGSVYTVKRKGMRFTATITQDPDKYEFYSDLGLDIFETVQTADVEKKKVANDSTGKGNGKHKQNDSANG